jgi:hypothetical protein
MHDLSLPTVSRLGFAGTFIVFSAIITSPLIMLYFSIRGAWTAHKAAKKAKAEGTAPPKPAADTSEEIAQTVEEAQLKVNGAMALVRNGSSRDFL